MGARCSICASEEAEAVDASLRFGWTQREIGLKFGFSTSAVGRHKRRHWNPPVVTTGTEIEGMVEKAVEQTVVPLVRRLEAETAPEATLRRALKQAGCTSPGHRTAVVDLLCKALADVGAWNIAGGFLRNAGYPEETVVSLCETLAEARGVDPWIPHLTLLLDQPAAKEGD